MIWVLALSAMIILGSTTGKLRAMNEQHAKCLCREVEFVSNKASPWVEFRCPSCGETHWIPF